ncbi:MAG: hypothetical protein Q9215_002614 [Flavoplaca cf. flavocitrina]
MTTLRSSIPAFHPPGTGNVPPADWSYNTAVAVENDGSSRQTYWIDTQDGSDIWSEELPYYGCLAGFHSLPRRTIERGQDDNGDCMQTFDEDCVRDTIEMAKQRTASFDETKDATGQVCSDLIQSGLPESCQKYLDPDSSSGSVVSGFGNNTSNDECPEPEGANHGFFSITSGGGTDADFDTQYDTAVTYASAIPTVVWAKRQNARIDPEWVDARFVCMRTDKIKAGSRVPDGVPEERNMGLRTAAGSILSCLALVMSFGFVWMF